MSEFDRIDLSRWEPPEQEPPEREPRRPATPPVPASDDATDPCPPAATDAPGAGGPVAWKAAASSVPKLRQRPVADPAEEPGDAFPGFAQDALVAHDPAPAGERPAAGKATVAPLSVEPPFWEIWLDHLRMIPLPVALGVAAGVVLVVVASTMLFPREQGRVSLARLRQQPEAFDGRVVQVRGKAGEAFSLGGSYVFNLRQGRDTIVVYSRTRRPHLHEDVRATGTVSVGYLDGVPRVALFEDPPSP